MTLLKLENVGKSYFDYNSEWKRFANWIGFNYDKRETQILKNIYLELDYSESLGIIGLNGAGKSTLLKLISGILEPTSGSISLDGTVAAILELGMGFNLEDSGRNNVYFTSSLMGYSKKQVDAKIEEIEKFADIGEFFDLPMRMYSSGMHVRVAFSVATIWEPNLLIIDEALSVGDIYFQQKCLNRIKMLQEKGTSLVLVSHDMQTIREFTNKCIFLTDNKFIYGPTDDIVRKFEDYNLEIDIKNEKLNFKSNENPYKNNNSVELILSDVNSNTKTIFERSERINLKIRYNGCFGDKNIAYGIMIRDALGRDVFCFNTKDYFGIIPQDGDVSFDQIIQITNNLVDGVYFISVSVVEVVDGTFVHLEYDENVTHFYATSSENNRPFNGICDMNAVLI